MNAKKAAAMIAIKADAKGLDKCLNDGRKKLRAFGGDAKKLGGKFLGAGKGALKSVGAGMGLQAAFGITGAIDSFRDFEKNLVRFQVTAGKSTSATNAFRDSIHRISRSTAVSREEILEGVSAYVALTGDVAGAEAAMESFARIAQASGAKTSEVATAAAALRDNFNIDPSNIEAAFSSLISQGKTGSVELKEFAAELSSIAPVFAQFGSMGGLEGVGELGAAFQIVRKGAGSASEAATNLRSMMVSLVSHAGKFEKKGVKIFNKDPKTGVKTMRNLSAIWHDINSSKLVNDPALLQEAFGRDEAKRAYDQLRKYPGLYDSLIASGMNYGAVTSDFGTVMASDAFKLEGAINNVKQALVEAFTPERIKRFVEIVQKVTEKLGKVIDLLGDLGDFLTGPDLDNPFLAPFGVEGQQSDSDVRAALQHTVDTGGSELDTDDASRQAYVSKAKQALADAAAYDDAKSTIESAGTSDEMLRRAVEAKYVGQSLNSNTGQMLAGDAALRAQKVSHGREFELRDQVAEEAAAAAAIERLGPEITKALERAHLTVNLDNNKVSSKQSNATRHRNGGG